MGAKNDSKNKIENCSFDRLHVKFLMFGYREDLEADETFLSRS